MKNITIKKNDANQRLDKFIRKALPRLSLPSIYKHIRNKRIKVNNKKAEIDYRVLIDDVVNIYLNDELLGSGNEKNDFLLAKNDLKVVYEDNNIIIVNKPSGIVVQDDNTKNPDTLCNRLLLYLYKRGEWSNENETTFVPSFIHRLDRNTQGLIIGAKNIESSRILSEKIKNKEIDKYYLCHVYGILDPKNGVLHDYLTKKSSENMVVISKKPISFSSKEIITEYKTISIENNISLLEIHLITGKTHQIRAHLNFIGHPLIGEKKYSSVDERNKKFQDLISYKLIFNLKKHNGILEYLSKKTIKI